MAFEVVGMSAEDRLAWQQALGVSRNVSLPLSSAEILSAFSSPVTAIPAPGAGKAVIVEIGSLLYLYGSTPYITIGNERVVCYYASQARSDYMLLFDVLAETSSQYAYTTSGLIGVPLSDIDNQPILCSVMNLDPTGGDGTASLSLTYRIIDLATGESV